MDNIKDDEYYRNKIISDIEHIIKHMENVNRDVLAENEILLDALEFRLIQISESTKHLSEKFKEDHSEVEWPLIVGLRNVLVHDYDNVDYDVVYETLKKDVVELVEQLKKGE